MARRPRPGPRRPCRVAAHRAAATLFLLLASACVRPLAVDSGAEGAPPRAPNVVVVLVDDLRHDVLGVTGHPFVETPHIDRLAREGTRFTNSFVTTSLCCPSRASLLTGLYAHAHGVTTNQGVDLPADLPTFPSLLRAAGYRTAFVGKWHMAGVSAPRPGFDEWFSFRGQGEYLDPLVNHNGTERRVRGYMTDLLTDRALEWIGERDGRPFCLLLSHKATHSPMEPAPRHAGRYAERAVEPPRALADTLAGKPAALRLGAARGWLTTEVEAASLQQVPAEIGPRPWMAAPYVRDYLETLLAVDDGVGRLMESLEREGLAEDTVVFFTSDNGFLFGEHAAPDKRLAWEDSIRVPLFTWSPGRVAPGTRRDELVLNVDLAPTILELAGVASPRALHGRSLVPLLAGDRVPWREDFFYEYFEEVRLAGIPTTLALRDERWKYVVYPDFLAPNEELYDLVGDPDELVNLADDAEQAAQLRRMRARLAEEQARTGYTLPAHARPPRLDEPVGGPAAVALDLEAARADGLDLSFKRLAFELDLRLTARAHDTVLLRYGDDANGFELALEDGRPALTLRASGLVRRVRDTAALTGRPARLRTGLAPDGRLFLQVDDGPVARAILPLGGIAGRARTPLTAPCSAADVTFDAGTLTWLGRQPRRRDG